MRVHKTLALGRSGFAAALCVVLLPEVACAAEPQNGSASGQTYNAAFALAPGFAPPVDNVWMANPAWGSPVAAPVYRSITTAAPLVEDLASPSFDIGGYDAMWDDTWFGEIAAYGGLERDALRIAGMSAMNGADGTSGAIPYGRLMLQREFQEGQYYVGLGAYGLHVNVQPTAISGFGDDSYTDVAVDGTWRWIARPERSASDMISAHVLVLHEDENLIASHAIFGTRSTDDLTIFRGDASWSWGANVTPAVQYFRITGSSDPIRLGTLDGSPNSKGWITEFNYAPSDDARSPLTWFDVRLSLQFVAYSEFDGSSHNAAHNNTVLLHLTAGGDAE